MTLSVAFGAASGPLSAKESCTYERTETPRDAKKTAYRSTVGQL